MIKAVKLAWLFLFLTAILLNPATAHAQDVNNFYFNSFDADYYLSRDEQGVSHLSVTENLTAVFPDYAQNHGILRALPETYQNHHLGLHVSSVTMDGSAYQYTTYEQNHNQVLKIGDPANYVTGTHVYKISYEYRDVISFYKDHDELFWDVNGDQWPQSFMMATARLHIPAELATKINIQPVCFEGYADSQVHACKLTVSKEQEGTLATVSSANDLRPHEVLSVALGFQPHTFKLSQAGKTERARHMVFIWSISALTVAVPLATFVHMYRRWRAKGNDPKGRGVIIPQYEPPKGLSLPENDFIYTEGLRQLAVTATIIDWAVRGHLDIIEEPKKGLFGHKSYRLELKSLPEKISQSEQRIMGMVFGDLTAGAKQELDELKSARKANYKALKETEDGLAEYLTSQGYFQANPKKAKGVLAGAAYSLVAVMLYFGLQALPFVLNRPVAIAFFVSLLFSIIIYVIFLNIMPARTESGVEILEWMKGLKDYIKMAEADRLKYLQSPEGAEKVTNKDAFNPKNNQQKVKLFEKLLPYAILFGLEKDWAKQFKDIYTSPPDWYSGNWTSFNAGYLAGSIGDFNSVNATAFSSPSSGGSGFSGGGAGGGGGGGGGGGW